MSMYGSSKISSDKNSVPKQNTAIEVFDARRQPIAYSRDSGSSRPARLVPQLPQFARDCQQQQQVDAQAGEAVVGGECR